MSSMWIMLQTEYVNTLKSLIETELPFQKGLDLESINPDDFFLWEDDIEKYKDKSNWYYWYTYEDMDSREFHLIEKFLKNKRGLVNLAFEAHSVTDSPYLIDGYKCLTKP